MLAHSFLDDAAAARPRTVALAAGGEHFCYGALVERSNRLANGLLAAGVRRGGRVVVFLDNCVEAAVSVWGTSKADGVFVLVSPSTTPEELAYIIADCTAWGLITDANKLASLELAAMPQLAHTLVVRRPPRAPRRTADFTVTLAASSPQPPVPRAKGSDLAALIYRSDATVKPSAVMVTHADIDAASRSISAYLGFYELLIAARLKEVSICEERSVS